MESNESKELKKNIFTDLGDHVTAFIDGIASLETKELEKKLAAIKDDIQLLIKEALIKDIQKADTVTVENITNRGMKLSMNNNAYKNILSAQRENPEILQRKLIAKATQGKIAKTIKELEQMVSNKKDEESLINEILGYETYDEILHILEMKCIKIQGAILSFEKTTNKQDFNRINYLLYYLGMKLGHSLKIYGNDREIYLYDKNIDRTFICCNSEGYQTYTSLGDKDLYEVSTAKESNIQRRFTKIPFNNKKEWTESINKLVNAPSKSEEKIVETAKRKNETEKEEEENIESKEETTIQLLRDEFKKLFPDVNKFNYAAFARHMKGKGIIIPKVYYSLNLRFGKTPLIYEKEYITALLNNSDDATIKGIEMKARDKWFEQSKTPKNIEIKESLRKYFSLSEEEQKTQAKEYETLLNNPRNKAIGLGGLPIGTNSYLKALVRKDLDTMRREETELIKEGKIGVYSKIIADVVAKFKDNGGEITDVIDYLKLKTLGGKESTGNGSASKGPKNTIYDRKSKDSIDEDYIRSMYDTIFPIENGQREIGEDRYKAYLKNNPSEQKILPKNIYGLIDCFKNTDAYANEMIHSIKYLQALIENNQNEAEKARIAYMNKKINEGKNEDILIMIMYIRRYIEKTNDDPSIKTRGKYATNEVVEKIKQRNPQVKKMLINGSCIISYALVDPYTNFNEIDFGSMKNALKNKTEEIRKIRPEIYAMQFNIVT